MVDSALRERACAAGLFDAEYYLNAHGDLIPAGADPFGHFLEVGAARGYLPSLAFDPALYRALVPECRDANPLLHCLDARVPFRPPAITEVFPGAAARVALRIPAEGAPVEALRQNVAQLARPRDINLDIDGRRYALTVPEPGAFLARLEQDIPFACVRLPHGFWDALWMLATAEAEVENTERGAALTGPERRALASRICAEVRGSHGAFAPAFMDEVLEDIPGHANDPAFQRAVSFKGQLISDDLAGYPAVPPQQAVMRLFAQHFVPGAKLYDGTLVKKLLITGNLRRLPELCRDREVILVANRLLGGLGRRWKLRHFTHVKIPRRRSQWQRSEVLGRAAEAMRVAIARAERPPVVLTQCGGSLANWLITRLYSRFPRAFYLDLGQALNGWFMETLDMTNMPWLRIFGPAVIENCGLEPFYRARLAEDYQRWREGFQ